MVPGGLQAGAGSRGNAAGGQLDIAEGDVCVACSVEADVDVIGVHSGQCVVKTGRGGLVIAVGQGKAVSGAYELQIYGVPPACPSSRI